MVLGLLVLGSSVMVFSRASQHQPKATSRTSDIQQARTTMESVIREIRQGSLASGTSSQLSVTYPAGVVCSGTCTVAYSCTSGNCTRSVSGSTRTLVSGLSSSAVFGYSVCPAEPTKTNYVTLTLVFPAPDGDDAITLSDGARLRNQCLPR